MSNICKTVTLRTRKIKGGEQLSFYLDYYPGYRDEWNIVKNNKGVWVSTRIFYIVGSFSLLSIITIVMVIVAYVYFHWFQ